MDAMLTQTRKHYKKLFKLMELPCKYLPVQTHQQKHQEKVLDMMEIRIKTKERTQ